MIRDDIEKFTPVVSSFNDAISSFTEWDKSFLMNGFSFPIRDYSTRAFHASLIELMFLVAWKHHHNFSSFDAFKSRFA